MISFIFGVHERDPPLIQTSESHRSAQCVLVDCNVDRPNHFDKKLYKQKVELTLLIDGIGFLNLINVCCLEEC